MKMKAPSVVSCWVVLAAARLLAAALSPISDCDEVYNYWEPLHWLAHDGVGFQTWEYDPKYALRSYLYLGLHYPAVALSRALGGSKLDQFFALRCYLALLCSLCEAVWLYAVRKRLGEEVCTYAWITLCFSTGFFVASAAFLPSSFAMVCVMLCQAFQMLGRPRWAVYAGALSVVVGWPFSAVALVPIGLSLVVEYGFMRCVRWGVEALVLTVVPTVAWDTHYYLGVAVGAGGGDVAGARTPNGWVFSTLNILTYNINPTGTGSELYGVEPWHFYAKNLFLNFNVGFLLALLSAPLLLILGDLRGLVLVAPFLVWFGFFSLMPHKEERFMSPVYHHLALGAALALQRLPRVGGVLARLLRPAIVLAFVALSLMRTGGLVHHYGAPLKTYTWLSHNIEAHALPERTAGDGIQVCLGKEWYRFPSHFFLPEGVDVRFLSSGFTGQLPQYFDRELGSRANRTNFNHENAEEVDRYDDPSTCDFVVDLSLDEQGMETREPWHGATCAYRRDAEEGNGGASGTHVCMAGDMAWQVVYEAPFLDAGRTPTLARMYAFPAYLPASIRARLGTKVYGHYRVFQRVMMPPAPTTTETVATAAEAKEEGP